MKPSSIPALDVPAVSVLMTCFNAERFVAEAVRSILSQSFTDWELIVVDDGSSDATLERILDLQDNRIRVLPLERNVGIPRALNTGLQKANGQFVARLDADDIAAVTRLADQVSYLEANPDVVSVGGSMSVVGKRLGQILDRKPSNSLGPLFLRGNQYLSSTVMFRRSCIEDFGLKFDESLPNAQDYDFWLQLSGVGRMAQLSTVLGEYRFHESQETARNALRQRRLALRVQTAAVMGRYGTQGTTNIDRLIGWLFLARHFLGYLRIKLASKARR